MNKLVKKHGKRALTLAGVGVGLSAASALAPNSGVGAMSSALPAVGAIYSMDMVIDSLDVMKKKSQKLGRF